MIYKELQTLFQQCAKSILTSFITDPDKFIRYEYPTEGAPDWNITDNIVFINSQELSDEYARLPFTRYVNQDDTVIAERVRTRVWKVLFTSYGPDSYDMSNALRDGFISEAITRKMTPSGVFLIPNWPNCIQANEMWAGRWWQRWDLTLSFNEEYVTTEDVGHIDQIHIRFDGQRRTK
ncbi:phage neck terminator protein [Megasphaera sueciensis]|uniref:phage neck terminator protein n=1 Tax=Megasphaera sueciensis TaxID=349094 RepID=UPI003D061BA3